MKRYLLGIAFYLVSGFNLLAQDYQRPIITYDRFGDGLFDFYAENPNHFPVQMRLDFTELENMQVIADLPYITTLEPGKQKLFQLRRIIVELLGNFNYKTDYLTGAYPVTHNDEALYRLPISLNKSAFVTISDQSMRGLSVRKALLFKVGTGDTICAAREGIVAQILRPREVNGMIRGTNTIIILHTDNTFGRYEQLADESFLVEPGVKIETGQPIGIAPNQGEPHLLFSVYHLNAPIDKIFDERIRDYQNYILPKFAISAQEKYELIDKTTYVRIQ